ncbi:MAG TPA: twin-arginine translocase TatA/TatE family subunit [Candidatus Thermoplasmatota archaeon]|nr:twin-arginine translocase TatA/TatE family subunit [Candidatus Thermoplasmatota archaeon]
MLSFLNVGATEILVIAVLALLLFGADRIPELARQLGRARAQFDAAAREFDRNVRREQGLESRPGDAVPRGHLDAQRALSDERLRRAARELGIDDAGKSPEELRRLLGEKLE